MAKANTPSFVLDIEMSVEPLMASLIEKELEINRNIQNTVLGELLKREQQMKQTKAYKKLKCQLIAISKKLALLEKKVVILKSADSKSDLKAIAEQIKSFKIDKNNVMKRMFDIQKAFGLFEYSIHEYMTPIRAHFQNTVNANVAQKTASRAWNAFQKKLIGKAKRVNFIRKGEMDSFEGKNNTTGWRCQDRQIVYKVYNVDLKIDPKDIYLNEALYAIDSSQVFEYTDSKGEKKQDISKVKYVRIVRKVIRGKKRYYAQLVCAGYPPVKRDKFGKERYPLGKGRVGTDIGTSSVAIVGERHIALSNLGEEIKRVDKVQREIRLLQRKMDRSKRAMNPVYNWGNGTIKKGKKEWVYSNCYLACKAKLKELHRKLALYRKYSHQRMANQAVTWGNEFYCEEMNFRALQKRAKETKISEKTGEFQRKKRFGKSIAHRAPAMFVSILKDKVEAKGGTFSYVNTWTFKASQYDHRSNTNKKKGLKDRWHIFDDHEPVQRDLYSAFLLKNANKTKSKTDRKLCLATFKNFQKLHKSEIARLEQLEFLTLNSGIKLSCKKEAVKTS